MWLLVLLIVGLESFCYQITLNNTNTQTDTLDRTPLDEGSALRTDLYRLTHKIHNRLHTRRDSNPHSRETSGRRTTPKTAWPLCDDTEDGILYFSENKPVPVSLCPPPSPHRLAQDRTPVSSVRLVTNRRNHTAALSVKLFKKTAQGKHFVILFASFGLVLTVLQREIIAEKQINLLISISNNNSLPTSKRTQSVSNGKIWRLVNGWYLLRIIQRTQTCSVAAMRVY